MFKDYNIDRMSTSCKTIYERGKFFIETGTAHTFTKFWKQQSGIIRYIPDVVFDRIEEFINNNERDRAVVLWSAACKRAEIVPKRKKTLALFIAFHIAIAVMATYAFIGVLTSR